MRSKLPCSRRTSYLLPQRSLAQHGQSRDKVREEDQTVIILVKEVEDPIRDQVLLGTQRPETLFKHVPIDRRFPGKVGSIHIDRGQGLELFVQGEYFHAVDYVVEGRGVAERGDGVDVWRQVGGGKVTKRERVTEGQRQGGKDRDTERQTERQINNR